MKVSFDKIERGISEYLDREFLAQYPETSVHKVLLGVGISLAMRQKTQEAVAFLNSDFGKSLGIMDEEGLIDIDLLRDTIKSQICADGVKYENRLIGTITFNKDDIDSLYSYITKTQ